MSHSREEPHVSDEVLLLELDGEVEGETREAIRAHLHRCPECLGRAEEIRELSAEFEEQLAALDRVPPASLLPRSLHEVRLRHGQAPRSARPVLRRAAAVLLLVAAGGLVASPLRARVIDWVERRLGEAAALVGITPAPSPPRAVGAPREEQERYPSDFSFTPEGAELQVEFAHAQGSGVLHVTGTREGSASFRVLGSESVLVLPSEIRVRNTAWSRASYRLGVPGTVEAVRVVVRGRPPVVVRPGTLPPGEAYPVPLSPGTAP